MASKIASQSSRVNSSQHQCPLSLRKSRGDPAQATLEEEEEDEPQETPLFESSADVPLPDVSVPSADDVAACYRDWLQSAAAAKLKEFLDRELPE